MEFKSVSRMYAELMEGHYKEERAKFADHFAMNLFLYVLSDNLLFLYHNNQRGKIVV